MKSIFLSTKLFLFIAFIFLYACKSPLSSGDTVELRSKNFSNEINLQQNLTFSFSEDLAHDTLIDKWLETEYITFKPEVKGKFKWTAARELVFSPEIAFQPSTDYTGALTNKLVENLPLPTQKLSLSGEKEFKFHTPYLALVNTEALWATNAQGSPEVRLNVDFNYKVNPADVANLTSLTIDKQAVTFKVVSTEVSPTMQLAVAGLAGTSFDGKNANITIKKGLKLPNLDYEAPEMTFETDIPDAKDFKIMRIAGETVGTSPAIHVFTNQTVGMTALKIKDLVKVEPHVNNVEIELTDFGFYVKGKFDFNGSYKIYIQKALQGAFANNLVENFEQYITFGELSPSIAFASDKSVYLSSKGQKNIAVKIFGIDKVNITVHKIFNNNINNFLREKVGFYNYSYGEENDYDYYYSDNYSGLENYGAEVFTQTYETKNMTEGNGGQIFSMDFIDRLPTYKGIYVVTVKSLTDQWKRASAVVSLSDIGLIAKVDNDNIWVFANSIMDSKSLKDVSVTLVSQNNQEVWTAKTDSDGLAFFPNLKKKIPDFTVDMITAQEEGGKDFTYMHFKQAAVGMNRFEIGGIKLGGYDAETGRNIGQYQAFIYGDRELYRPDEIANIKTIIRDRNYKPIAGIPIKMKVLLPDGNEFAVFRGVLSEQGSFETTLNIPAAAVTGSYSIEVYTSNDVFLNSKSISIEEFMPDRIRVGATLDKDIYKAGETVTLKSQVMNLFGTPAANRKYEVTGTLNRKYFSAKGVEEFNFTLYGSVPNVGALESLAGTTDEQGNITATFNLPNVQFAGLLTGTIYVTAFDETGRSVTASKTFEVETQSLYYGLKLTDYYHNTRTPIAIGLVAVNRQGQVANTAKGKVTVIRYDWQSVLERDYNNSYRYVSQRKEVVVQEQTVTIQGKTTTYPFVATRSGEYEVRLTATDNNQTYTLARFYAYSWGSTESSSFEVDKDGEIKIVADQPKYKVGETAKFLLKTPFEGRILVTVEQGTLKRYFYAQSDKKAAEVSVKIENDYVPNVYITATLIKPATQTSIPLTVAHGFQSVTVENPDNVIPLEIKAVEKTRSETKQEIIVKSGKREAGIEVTVAVVDEGILLKKRYENPNPYAFFFQKRALEVKAFDLYPRLFPEIRTLPRTFGADDYDMSGRTNPLANKRVKLLSFWSKTLKTDANGEVRYTVNLPKFSGSARIVAVAHKNSGFGSAVKNMIIADPVIVSTSLPRFLSPNDEVDVTMTIMNTTAQQANGKASIDVSGAIEVTSTKNAEVSISPNGEKQVKFTIKAKEMIGTAKVNVNFAGLGESFKENLDITVRPSTSLLKTSNSGVIEKSATLDLAADYIQSSVAGKLIVSKSPAVQFAKNLAYLVQYPYGCVEQTTSTAFPQIYFGEIAKSLGDTKLQLLNPQRNVQEAIQKLQTMQLYNGALTYWEGASYETWFGTVYAAHFLTEAKKAGFEVERKFLDKIYAYLDMKVKRKNTQDYIYFDAENKRIVARTAPKEIAYSLYILAMAGQADKSTMNYYKANPDLLTLDSKYLLAMAYQLIGDMPSTRAILPAKYEALRAETEFDGSFSSTIRDRAMALNALIDTDEKNAQIEVMARHLSQEMKAATYLNTQENAFGLLALGKLAKKANESSITANISVNGNKIATFDNKPLILTKEVAGKKVDITVAGQGKLYYYYEIEGLNASGTFKEEDNYLKVRRNFFDRNGKAINQSSTLKKGDMLVIRLDLQAINTQSVPNVVITDMLPAGFEIENPRLSNIPNVEWIKDGATAEHFDFRDDRVNIFVTATEKTKSFYYVVRCVSSGSFRMGPISADAMYNGEYHSYHGAGTVVVQ
jgi:uncharacterized protein YfaS (alpha-2-macroglobulin family)